MISLHVYLTPKPGREKDLADAICNKWLVAMSEQPGFLSAGLLEPFSDDELAKLGASTPETTYEVIKSGAHGIAVISAVCASPNPKQATQSLLTEIQRGKQDMVT